jgi:general secretion pathway protein J
VTTRASSSRIPPRGFTLLELVVVMAIFTVLSVMAYGGLGSILTARTQVAQSLERTAALQKGYLRLRDDFQQLRARPARDNYGATQPALHADRGVVEFTRGGWRNPLGLPRSALERVAYRLEDGRLLRMSWRVLDRATGSEPVEVAVLDQVEDAQWRFLDQKLEWQAQWPSAAATVAGAADPEPPRAVELTLVLKDLGEVRYLFSARNAS